MDLKSLGISMTLEQAIKIIQRAEKKYVSTITYCTAMKVCMEHGYETVEEIMALKREFDLERT